MDELISRKYNKRVIFLKDKQKEFLLEALKNLGIFWFEFGKKIKVHKRILND